MDLDRSGVALFATRILLSFVGFISTVYFARELGAGGLGVYFAFETVVTLLAVAARYGVDDALINRLSGADGESERETILSTAFALVVLPLVFLSLTVLLFADPLNSLFGATFAGLLVLTFVGSTTQWLLISALRGERRVATTAGIELAGELARVGLSVALVLLGLGVVGLVYGLLVGHVVRTLIAVALIRTSFGRPTWAAARDLFGFAKYAIGMNISQLAFSWTDTLVLVVVASSAAVGIYESAWRVSLVVMLASSSLGVALAPSVSNWYSSGDIARVESAVTESLTYGLLVVIPAIVGAALLGEAFVETVYEFDRGGTVLLILVTAMLFQGVKDVVQSTLLGIDDPRTIFWTNMGALGSNLVLTILLASIYGMIGAAVATTATAAVAAGLQVRALEGTIQVQFDTETIGYQVGAALIMGLAIVAARQVVPAETIPGLFGLVALGGAVYVGVILTNQTMRDRLLGLLPWSLPLPNQQ